MTYSLQLFVKSSSLIALVIGLIISVQLQTVAAATSVRPAGTEVNGQLTVNALSTSNRSPILSGTMPAACNDMTVSIYRADLQGNHTLLISTQVNGFTFDGAGNWSVDLAANGTTLGTGWHDVNLFSDCGYSEDFTRDYYRDINHDRLFIYPVGCDASCVPVYRLYENQKGVHFYTANPVEGDIMIAQRLMPNFSYEGISSFARSSNIGGLIPVHRFYNFKQGVHFYTSNQTEATHVNNTAFHTYRYEGVAYYTSATQVANTVPVHRFYNFKNGVHFFTSNQAEATHVNNTAFHTYRYEGVASYNVENK